MSDWLPYAIAGHRFEFPPGTTVLDVGCGEGLQSSELAQHGVSTVGIDVFWPSLEQCRAKGLTVAQSRAEALPLLDGSVDGFVCKVVLPYTDERLVVEELGRVLRPGGVGYLVTHGSGYFLRYLITPPHWKLAFYGARTLLNTWIFAVTGRRLPGFVGDSIYQSRRRLRRLSRSARLQVVSEQCGKSFLGFPVFLYYTLTKS